MARKLLIGWTLATLALAGAAVADDGILPDHVLDRLTTRSIAHQGEVSAATDLAKASGDTIYLLGGPDRLDGRFEDATGQPAWHGWTSVDFTDADTDNAWHVQDQYVLSGSYSMVCGAEIPQPAGSVWGYGNNWRMALLQTHAVDDPSQTRTLRVTGTLRVDTEPQYDYVYLQVQKADTWVEISDEAVWDGVQDVSFDFSTSFRAGDYSGSSDDEIRIRFYFASDGAASDQDGDYDSDGACLLDDVTVMIDGATVAFDDFEDGTSGNWTGEVLPGAGDFAALYGNLQDLDPCRGNPSIQVAFVDNGVVVPGTGGTPCITWCYGPEGYIVNNTGGLLGPENHVENGIVSPALAWQEGHDAAELELSLFVHEPMTSSSGGTMFIWWVRSTTADDPAMLEYAEWTTDFTVWYGPPIYVNHLADLTSYLEPGRKWFQVRLEVWEAGWIWGIEGADGTPHPYIDNVRIRSYPFAGPAMSHNDLFLAQDSFPEQGDIDFGNLAANSIRFDAARNISPATHLRNDPGDSLWVDVVPVREGSTLPQLPQMVVRMKANPVFDGVRALPPGFSQDGAIITGTVTGDSTYNAAGNLVADRYNFDLPDTGFFYPGDVIHYYFEAWDEQGGDIGHTTLPGDTTGFASFDHDLSYPSNFICRGLPTLFSPTAGDQPRILFWNDFADFGGENEWYHALSGCGLEEGVDYDIYYTIAPDAGEGNGLGGRATSAVLDGYDILLYTSGTLFAYTLGEGDYTADASQDIQVLNSWFARGGKKAVFTGDDLVSDLMDGGSLGQALVNNYLGVQFFDNALLDYIGHQTAPTVRTYSGNGILPSVDTWIAYGGCLGINTFDAVQTVGSAQSLAEFTDANGNGGTYPYTAAVYNYNQTTDTEVIYLPYDFMFVYNAPGYQPPAGLEGLSARAVMLRDIFNAFGQQLEGPIGVGDMPQVRTVDVMAYPNPFNPQTTLALSLPRAGHVSVKIFNVRGELVRTLQDGPLTAGRHELRWDGRDSDGSRQASGVYFAETRALGQTEVTRMAMIK